MCLDPLTLTVAATAVSMVGQGVSTSYAMGQAGYEARVARQNARQESERAFDALDRGREEGRRHDQRTSVALGRQRAALAANGIDPSFGSAAAVQGDMAAAGQDDAATIAENARRTSHLACDAVDRHHQTQV